MVPLVITESLDHCDSPEHLLVLGAGYVGLELAQAMRRFGSRVTIIDRNARMLADREDEDVSQSIYDLFRDEGIELVLGAQVISVEGESSIDVKITVIH